MRTIESLSIAIALFGSAASASADYWMHILNAGNACDLQSQGCFGAVGYSYLIGTNEVTNEQYAQFLNAKAASDPLGLYNTSMGSGFGGIARSGSPGSYTYTAIAGREQLPVNFVSLYDAMRYANWFNNGGSPASDTEDGVYSLLGGTPIPSNGATVVRELDGAPHAADGPYIFLPSEDEWYKAAYYDGATASYFDYPAGSDLQTVCSAPTATPNRANCDSTYGDVANVGVYLGSASPYGTFDQGGNVAEWSETVVSAGSRVVRGGSFVSIPDQLDELAAAVRQGAPSAAEHQLIGFRVAPEPRRGPPLAAGVALLGWLRHRRRR